MTLVDPRTDPAAAPNDADDLIKEARRLRRRRWFLGSLLAVVAAGAGVGGYLAASSAGPGAHNQSSVRSRNPARPPSPRHVVVPTRSPDLIQPTTLAALPDGDLLILDSSRDQILELTPDGNVSVFAGTGRLGFSGDGGPARDADLDFQYFSSAGMTVTPNGSVSFLDDGDCRIREVDPAGIIRTVFRVPMAKSFPSGTVCPVAGFALSPGGVPYVAINSEIERVSSTGHLVWVAGAHGASARGGRPYLTPSHVAFFPGAMAFAHGDLYIWNSSPKYMFELSPKGKLAQLGVIYATQLTTTPNGVVLAGTQEGWIQQIRSARMTHLYDVNARRVRGIDWPDGGFQEDGIAATKNGTIYVDNARGNGWGWGTVLVRVSPTRRAALDPIRTPLSATLPRVNAPGFSSVLYPAARGSRGAALSRCPSYAGLRRFTPSALATATNIAKTYRSAQFASDIAVSDRAWWTADFNAMQTGGGFGTHTVAGEEPAAKSRAAGAIARACGPRLVGDSVAITVGRSGYSDFTGTLYFLDRDGHPLVYDVR